MLWVLSIVTAAGFFSIGAYMFSDGMDEQFQAWGYPPGLDAAVGILQMVGAIGLLFKRAAGWSAVGLMVIMLAAAWTHRVFGELIPMIVPLVTSVFLGLIAWGRGLPLRARDPGMPSAVQT